MKIVLTEEEVMELLKDQAKDMGKEGEVPVVKLSHYSSDYVTITFETPKEETKPEEA